MKPVYNGVGTNYICAFQLLRHFPFQTQTTWPGFLLLLLFYLVLETIKIPHSKSTEHKLQEKKLPASRGLPLYFLIVFLHGSLSIFIIIYKIYSGMQWRLFRYPVAVFYVLLRVNPCVPSQEGPSGLWHCKIALGGRSPSHGGLGLRVFSVLALQMYNDTYTTKPYGWAVYT